MNRFIQGAGGTVMFRMSAAAEYYREDAGMFEVKYHKQHTRSFPTLLDAFLFYYTVEEEAELWDLTTSPVMIENKIKLFLN